MARRNFTLGQAFSGPVSEIQAHIADRVDAYRLQYIAKCADTLVLAWRRLVSGSRRVLGFLYLGS